ncbi:MAG: hypothetical protein J07AB43_13620 [Candidatus Nanosalina sp. J07AB43]|nr:MAG: hypothetical protein J07AB43_13620 [Candidatus Nanosalina sp. J07AB43]
MDVLDDLVFKSEHETRNIENFFSKSTTSADIKGSQPGVSLWTI